MHTPNCRILPPFPLSDFPPFLTDEIYLDNAATTQKPYSVISAVSRVDYAGSAPVHRGLYGRSEELTLAYEAIRRKCALWCQALPHEVVITSGATAGIATVAYAWAQKHLRAGDTIAIPIWEHHANIAPWIVIAQATGAHVVFIPLAESSCSLDYSSIRSLISTRTKIVALSPHTNTFGAVPRRCLEAMIEAAQKVGAVVVVDATQAMLHAGPESFRWMDPDFVVFSSHKMCGPSGVGVLLAKERRHHELFPYAPGGGMIDTIDEHSFTTLPMPHTMESGTPPISSWIGFGAALEYITRQSEAPTLHKPTPCITSPINPKRARTDPCWSCTRTRQSSSGPDNEQSAYERGLRSTCTPLHEEHPHTGSSIQSYEAHLIRMLIDALSEIPGITMYGDIHQLRQEGHILSWSHASIHAHDIAMFLANQHICVRAGTHCAQPVHTAWKIPATVRISVAPYTTATQIETCIDAIRESIHFLSHSTL